MAKLTTPILLVIEREGQAPQLEEFNENIIKIGKLSSVNLRLDDPSINRIHAVVEVTAEDEAQVIDMGSSKGTRVNGKRIHKSRVVSGDQILLGDTNILIYIGERAVAQARSGVFTKNASASDDANVEAPTSQAASISASAAPIAGSNASMGFAAGAQIGSDVGGYGGVDAQSDDLGNFDLGEDLGSSTQVTRNPLLNAQAESAKPAHNPEDTAPFSPEAAAAVQHAANQPPPQEDWYAAEQAQQQALYEQQQQQAQQQALYEQQQQAQQQALYEQQQAAAAAAAAAAYQQPPAQAYGAPASMPYAAQAPYHPQPTGGYPQPQMAPQQPPYATGGFAGYPQQPNLGMQQMPSGAFPQAAPVANYAAPAPISEPTSAPAVQAQDSAQYGDTQEVLEVRVLWGDTVLDHAHFYDPKRITIGESRKNTFSLSSEALPEGLTSFTLIEADGDRLMINFTDAMQGTVQIKEQNFTLDQIKQSAKVQKTDKGYQFALPAQSQVRLSVGEIVFAISFVPAPKRIPPSVFTQMDHHLARSMGASFLIHGIVLLFMLFSDEPSQSVDLDFFKQNNRFAQLIIRPEEPEKEKKKKQDGGGAKAKGKEGKMGRKKDAPNINRRAGQKQRNPDGTAPIDMQKTEKELLDTIGKKGMLGLLGAGGGNQSYGAILTAKGFGGDDADAIGGWHGAKVGDAAGSGGLGVRGGGGGGGGFSGTSVGLGQLGTYGRGGGRGGRGWGQGRLGDKNKRAVDVSTGPPVIFGALDKEIIRRIINQHRNQIKYCYERELIKHPKLQGTIKVFFQIEGNGRVSTSRVTQTTMNNDRTEECIVRRVRYWRFPAPKGGGIVHVNYPFYFKPS